MAENSAGDEMGGVNKSFPRNPDYRDFGTIGSTWTNTVTKEVWECIGRYDIHDQKISDIGYIWKRKTTASESSVKLPYIEETYGIGYKIREAVLHGHTRVRDYMFYLCELIESVSLQHNVTRIGKYAFYQCSNLVISLHVNEDNDMADEMHPGILRSRGISQPTKSILPGELITIGESAFYGCNSLLLDSLPDTLQDIGDSAFYNCTGLTSITFEGTPSSIANNAFEGCTNLTEIKVPWAEGAVANAPWGATNATITYNYTSN